MAKADIDFEKELWNAANELRGAVSENNYKNYILPLVFLKHLSERYDIIRDEIEGLMEDPKSDYYTTDKEERNYVLGDQDEYRSRNTFVVPKTASWQYLKDNAEQDDIKVKIDDAFDVLQDLLTEHNPQLVNLLPRIFVKSELSAKQTGGIINLLSHPKFSEKENPESDILGRIYEFYIGRFAMAEGSGAGQFFTPGSIVRLLVGMLEPYKGRIFDPACGSGGMFVQSLKFINEHGGNKKDIAIYGQEMTAQTLRLCLMNLLLRDLSFDIKLGNSLLDDKFPQLKADYIIANPPFNVSNWHPEDLPEGDPRLFGPKEEFTTDGSANYMWMQTFWNHLSTTGTAGVVMANGAMTSNTKGEKNVRQHMVDNSMVDAIVRMPDKLFLTTGIPACLFILSKNRDGKDGTQRERNNEILFIDASKMGTMASRKLRVFTDEDVKKIADTYHIWRTSAPLSDPNTEELTLSDSRAVTEQSRSTLTNQEGEVCPLTGSRAVTEQSRSTLTNQSRSELTNQEGEVCPLTGSRAVTEQFDSAHQARSRSEVTEQSRSTLTNQEGEVCPLTGSRAVTEQFDSAHQARSRSEVTERSRSALTNQGGEVRSLTGSAPLTKHEVEVYQDVPGFCKAATLAEVQKQDYKLTPGIYVGTEAEEDDGIPFETKMAALKAQLLAQFEKGEELKKQILTNFDKL